MAVDKPTAEQIQAFINQELATWSVYAEQVLRGSLDKKKLRVTDELYNSLSTEQRNATADLLAKVTIGFGNEGRIVDMKAVTHTKPLSNQVIEELIEPWVKKVGLSKFSHIPGYKEGRIPTLDIAAKRIAWGIGQGIVKGKWVRRAWYSKKMSGLIHQLTDRLVTNAAAIIAASGAKEITL